MAHKYFKISSREALFPLYLEPLQEIILKVVYNIVLFESCATFSREQSNVLKLPSFLYRRTKWCPKYFSSPEAPSKKGAACGLISLMPLKNYPTSWPIAHVLCLNFPFFFPHQRASASRECRPSARLSQTPRTPSTPRSDSLEGDSTTLRSRRTCKYFKVLQNGFLCQRHGWSQSQWPAV